MKGNGGKTTTSTHISFSASIAHVSSPNSSVRALPNATASSSVAGFIFQLPAMIGCRCASKLVDDEDEATGCRVLERGEKAPAVVAAAVSRAAVSAEVDSFILVFFEVSWVLVGYRFYQYWSSLILRVDERIGSESSRCCCCCLVV